MARQPRVEQVGLLRPVRTHQGEPQGLRRQGRLRRPPDLRRAAQDDAQVRRRVLRPYRHAAQCAEHRQRLHPPRHRGDRAVLHRRAPFPRRRRRREGRGVVGHRQGQPRRDRHAGGGARHVRLRLCVAARALVAVAAQRGGRDERRPRQSGGQFLLRRLRQQLCRPRRGEALSRLRLAARASASTKSAARATCGRWWNGTCRR